MTGGQTGTALPFQRPDMVAALGRGDEFDMLVIGGGITGCGIALDAASRGLSVALVERDDFASGTSSKSSKLIHGGLRYLQQGDVRLVYEALRERQRLLRNAPHLVSILPFLIPVLTRDGPVSKRIAKALRSALWMYDLTGGLRIGKRHHRLGAAATLRHCPTLPREKVSSGFVYYDAAADDARVTLAVARTAAEHGAVVVNRCGVTDLVRAAGRVRGAVVDPGGEPIAVRARTVVAAAGVWADEVRTLDEGADPDAIRPAKGIHLTVPWELVRNEIAVIIAVPSDKRSLFLVPWGQRADATFDRCYIGTTDTEYTGDLVAPHADDADLAYVLSAVNRQLATEIGRDDVTAAWAGLRPLVKQGPHGRTADLSRRHQVSVSDGGLISVTGGKFTTYRQMAEDTVDVALAQLGRRARCRTARLRLAGATAAADHAGRVERPHLLGRYGTMAADVERLIADEPALQLPLVAGLRYLRAEAVYAVRHEMATTLLDVLARRTRAHLEHRDACLAAAPSVAALIGRELGWSAATIREEVAAYRAICDAERDAARGARPERA